MAFGNSRPAEGQGCHSLLRIETIILVTNFWTWASIVGLSTPNLVLGPSVAVGVGIAEHYSPWILLPVVTVASYHAISLPYRSFWIALAVLARGSPRRVRYGFAPVAQFTPQDEPG